MLMTQELTTTEKSSECKPVHKALLRVDAPIREVPERHRDRILRHLLALDERDRYLRFGYMANDAQIERYVNSLDFSHDELYGVYDNQLELVALAHLAYSEDPEHRECAEFGGSVNKSERGRGLGQQLFDRAVLHCRNRGVYLLFIHALSENKTMLRIARNAGATVERSGSESEAHLVLPEATVATRIEEMLDDGVARTDYRIKQQVRQFWTFLDFLHDLRHGAAAGRQQSGR